MNIIEVLLGAEDSYLTMRKVEDGHEASLTVNGIEIAVARYETKFRAMELLEIQVGEIVVNHYIKSKEIRT